MGEGESHRLSRVLTLNLRPFLGILYFIPMSLSSLIFPVLPRRAEEAVSITKMTAGSSRHLHFPASLLFRGVRSPNKEAERPFFSICL